jgi:hypothetical protein
LIVHLFREFYLVKQVTSIYNYPFIKSANVAELVDALDLGSSRLSCESSSLSIRTTQFYKIGRVNVLFSVLISRLPVFIKILL